MNRLWEPDPQRWAEEDAWKGARRGVAGGKLVIQGGKSHQYQQLHKGETTSLKDEMSFL